MTNTFLPLRRVVVVLAALALGAVGITSFSSTAKASTTSAANWLQVGSAPSDPSARYDGSMAYDAATATTVLFGGFNSTQLADTWTWNGASWTKQSPATSPPAMQGAAMVYDSATHNVVLFGGLTSAGPVDNTWTWNGATWTQQLVSGPPARSDATMVYDANTNDVVLFGGQGATGPLSDTWTWNGTQWTTTTISNPAPQARSEQSMVYDPSTKNVVLFGGKGVSGALQDTWTWDGATWTQQPAASPPARFGASIFYDSTTNQVVLFGGNNGSASLSDTWIWNGSSWTVLSTTTAPSARYLAGTVYDTATNNGLIFGGKDGTTNLSDLWSFSVASNAPTNVRATSNQNAQSVVTWNAPSSGGGGVIFGYVVTTTDLTDASHGGQTCQPNGGTTTVTFGGVAATSCTATGLTNGDQYTFAVSAINSVGTGPSALSNTARPATVPQAPTISKVLMTAGVANVYWTVPAQDGGTPVSSYRVTASPGGAFCHVPRSMTSCRIGGLQSGTQYTFTMTASNAAGTSLASVASAAVQGAALPGAPFITSKSVARSLITIRWRAPLGAAGAGIVGYDVYVGLSPSHAASRPLVPVPSNRLFYTFRGVPGRTYFVIVRAVNGSGIGPFSNQVADVAGRTYSRGLRAPSAPLVTSTSVSGPYVTIRWSPPASNGGERLSGYDLYIGTSPNGAASRPVVAVPFTQFAYSFRATPGRASYVIVRAINTVGIGPFSNQVVAVAK